MPARPLQEKDLAIIWQWMEKYDWPFPPREGAFPKDGFVCEVAGELRAAIFLFLTGTAHAFLRYTITSPELPKQLQMISLNECIEALKVWCSLQEPKIQVEFLSDNTKLCRHLEKNLGFKPNRKMPEAQVLLWYPSAPKKD